MKMYRNKNSCLVTFTAEEMSTKTFEKLLESTLTYTGIDLVTKTNSKLLGNEMWIGSDNEIYLVSEDGFVSNMNSVENYISCNHIL